MTLLQMSYILEVDRCGSMNRAARNLFLSQSALSAAIAEVERELGVTIFLRTNRGVTLTEEGRELTAQIAPLVERSRKLERYYSERRAADRVSLSVASQRYPFCAKAFVEFLHLLDEPHIQVSFKEMEMAAVIDEVTARRSAFGIIFVSDMTEHFIGRILREKNPGCFCGRATPCPANAPCGWSSCMPTPTRYLPSQTATTTSPRRRW